MAPRPAAALVTLRAVGLLSLRRMCRQRMDRWRNHVLTTMAAVATAATRRAFAPTFATIPARAAAPHSGQQFWWRAVVGRYRRAFYGRRCSSSTPLLVPALQKSPGARARVPPTDCLQYCASAIVFSLRRFICD